jgi:hypothetical protein
MRTSPAGQAAETQMRMSCDLLPRSGCGKGRARRWLEVHREWLDRPRLSGASKTFAPGTANRGPGLPGAVSAVIGAVVRRLTGVANSYIG